MGMETGRLPAVLMPPTQLPNYQNRYLPLTWARFYTGIMSLDMNFWQTCRAHFRRNTVEPPPAIAGGYAAVCETIFYPGFRSWIPSEVPRRRGSILCPLSIPS